MTPHYSTIHAKFRLDGKSYTKNTLTELAYYYVKEGEDYQKHIGNFLLDWLDDKSYVLVKTSGSTGAPKIIKLKKQAMVNSAKATGDFFDLLPGNSALHCLPNNFIAGKMMLVRAIVLGLELDIVNSTSKPLDAISKTYDFSAMVPLQVQNSLEKLRYIKTLIIGGAIVSESLKVKLVDLQTCIYATYGMTETITHIAVKRLNHSENTFFKVLPNIHISKDNRDCLIINAPHLNDEVVVTNDIISIKSDSEFELLGRYDNVINSGGIKLIPEQIEKKLQGTIPYRFFIASMPHERLGEQLVIVVESKSDTISTNIFNVLDKYERPKKIYYLKQFVETQTSKLNRKATLQLL